MVFEPVGIWNKLVRWRIGGSVLMVFARLTHRLLFGVRIWRISVLDFDVKWKKNSVDASAFDAEVDPSADLDYTFLHLTTSCLCSSSRWEKEEEKESSKRKVVYPGGCISGWGKVKGKGGGYVGSGEKKERKNKNKEIVYVGGREKRKKK